MYSRAEPRTRHYPTDRKEWSTTYITSPRVGRRWEEGGRRSAREERRRRGERSGEERGRQTCVCEREAGEWLLGFLGQSGRCCDLYGVDAGQLE